ncbi:hypothetical protein IAQ61_001944 [Plenodomus lingam]|uniref:uncharacterized protein n=1 Tax=Leptosphaeria maculans TaxID=5022 RepID=UPI003322B31B|nr:hypothetical protein IAQ61_001944 [Plenodomus lingam]
MLAVYKYLPSRSHAHTPKHANDDALAPAIWTTKTVEAAKKQWVSFEIESNHESNCLDVKHGSTSGEP